MTQNNEQGWSVLLTGKNLWLTLALAGGICLHAINVYITITTLPSVVRDIGGIRFYAWNTTLFILSSIILSALTSRILNHLGPKRSYLLATAIFLIGSVICAITPSMFYHVAWPDYSRSRRGNITDTFLLNGAYCFPSAPMVKSISHDVEYVGDGNITGPRIRWFFC